MSTEPTHKPLVRIFSPFFPFPPHEGAATVIFNQIVEYAANHRVELLCWKSSPAEIEQKRKAKWLENFPPEIEVRVLKTRQEKSRVARIMTSLFGRYASVEEFYYPELLETPVLEPAELEIFHYSFCLKWLEHAQASIGKSNAKKRVCHFHNIESELFRQRASDERNPLKLTMLKRFTKQLSVNELRLTRLVDECWMLSQVDLNLLQTRAPGVRAHLAPIRFSKAFQAARATNRQPRRSGSPNQAAKFKAGLIGGLDFKPNEDSALFVLEQVCPEIARQKLPIEILIGGKNPTLAILAAAKPYPFVQVLGFVENIEGFWAELDCMLVPQLSGSGVRIKLVEALASGVAVITNHEACAPLDAETRSSPLLHECTLNEFPAKLSALAKRCHG